MARQRRIDIPGTYHHVIVRGLERKKIFQDEEDREELSRRLEEALKKSGCQCHAWCLMPNHFHLLIKIAGGSITQLMRILLSGYAGYFNRKHKRSGYLYQNRYKSILCQKDGYYLELVRYIHLNPYKAGIVKDIGELDRYRGTGHSVIVGKRKNKWQEVDEVLRMFGGKRKEAVLRYREYVREGMKEEGEKDFLGGGLVRSVGGWEVVKQMRRENVGWQSDERIMGDGDFVKDILDKMDEVEIKRSQLERAGWTLKRIKERIIEATGIKEAELGRKTRREKVVDAKGMICYLGYEQLGISSRELAMELGMTMQGARDAVRRGEKLVKEYKIQL